MNQLIKRYGLFLISVWIIGLGISIITQSNLGTTAVTSLPFVLSAIFPLSFGTFTMLMNVLLVFLQLAILKKDFQKKQYLQFFVGPLLGISIDSNGIMFSFLQTSPYIIKLFFIIIGCVILAFGIFLQLSSQTIYNPTEGIVNTLAVTFHKPFGNVKLFFDNGLILFSVILSLVVLGKLIGIREGTVLSALLIGPFTNFFKQHLGSFFKLALIK
ncbi:hypothetical protein JTF06_07515 [Desemzia sp. RIT804]|uniref:YczE/YyaS/YitT family protein n=1 Tax=Desemzia sp. RIT 804 TaxID=2810209 RepID=UPI00194F5B6D|nr:DUF6198 family protein [Desemzia sp. RIT 804]MBM6614737.1 hypothetical protein [Desemzia sp. RIT 804]